MFAHVISFFHQASDLVFWGSALFGTMLFLLRLCATVIGGMTEEFGEVDEIGVEDGHGHHSATGSFKLFTIHTISGFFMMFGWVGLACVKQLNYSHQISMMVAILAGLITMVLTAFIFKGALLLVSTGTQFDIKKTVGLVGTVYQRIPNGGQGKIQLVVDGVTREILAQDLEHRMIESFKAVRVIKVLDHETVTVKEINS